jgi:hypothetical protein
MKEWKIVRLMTPSQEGIVRVFRLGFVRAEGLMEVLPAARAKWPLIPRAELAVCHDKESNHEL